MRVLSYPLRYLSLEDESGRKLLWRNWISVLIIALCLTIPFVVTGANFFAEKGFLDRFGSIAAVLTGFYIAALVGVASFSANIGDVDDPIGVGKIIKIDQDGETEELTRRQYVCSLFGYLAFISLGISILTALSLTFIVFVADAEWRNNAYVEWLSAFIVFFINVVIAHMIVTTCHGLYYLIDRLYYKSPTLLPKKSAADANERRREPSA